MREGNMEAGASDTHSSDSGEHIGREISRRVEEQGQAKHGRFGWFLFNVLPPKVKGINLSQVSIHSFQSSMKVLLQFPCRVSVYMCYFFIS